MNPLPREKCSICSREMIDAAEAPREDDPRIDCGGNCLYCQFEAEFYAPPGVRCTKPAGWDDDHAGTHLDARL